MNKLCGRFFFFLLLVCPLLSTVSGDGKATGQDDTSLLQTIWKLDAGPDRSVKQTATVGEPAIPETMRSIGPATEPNTILDAVSSSVEAAQPPSVGGVTISHEAIQSSIDASSASQNAHGVNVANAQIAAFQNGNSPAQQMNDNMDSAFDETLAEDDNEDDMNVHGQQFADNMNGAAHQNALMALHLAGTEAAAEQSLIAGQVANNQLSPVQQASVFDELGIEGNEATQITNAQSTAEADYDQVNAAVATLDNSLETQLEAGEANSASDSVTVQEVGTESTGIEGSIADFGGTLNAIR